MTRVFHLSLVSSLLLTLSIVEASQCCGAGVANLIRTKWIEAMSIMDTESRVQVVHSIVSQLQRRSPVTAELIRGRAAMNPAYRQAGEKHAYLKLLREMGILVDLTRNQDGMHKHVQHFILSNHIHYGSEVEALTDAMVTIYWAVFQITDLNPAVWHSCMYEIMEELRFQAARAITARAYARCDISVSSGEPHDPVFGTIVFEQPFIGGSTVVRGKLYGFNTDDDNIQHAMHVHSIPALGNRCKDAMNHFNPYNMTHGAPYEKTRHVGDLGNISEDEDGNADIYFWDNVISLSGENNIIGRSLVIHSSYDSFRSPSTFGARAACCIITKMPTPQF